MDNTSKTNDDHGIRHPQQPGLRRYTRCVSAMQRAVPHAARQHGCAAFTAAVVLYSLAKISMDPFWMLNVGPKKFNVDAAPQTG